MWQRLYDLAASGLLAILSRCPAAPPCLPVPACPAPPALTCGGCSTCPTCPSCVCGGQAAAAECPAPPETAKSHCSWSYWLTVGSIIGVFLGWFTIFLYVVVRGLAAQAVKTLASSLSSAPSVPQGIQYGYIWHPRTPSSGSLSR